MNAIIELSLNELAWSEPKVIDTRRGAKRVRSAILPSGTRFWNVWREYGGELKANGYGVGKHEGVWQLTEWREVNGEHTDVAKEVAKERAEEQAAMAEIPKVEIPAEIAAKLFPFQVPSAQRLIAALRNGPGALDGSDLGSGKTYVALAVCKTLGLTPGIICPKAVIPTWHRALRHFGMQARFCINYEMLRRGTTRIGTWVDEGNAKHFEFSQAVQKTPMLLLWDECQKMKTRTSLNCKMGTGALRQKIPCVAISGTIAASPQDMYFTGQLATLHKGGPDFMAFCKGHGVVKGRFGFFYKGGPKLLAIIHRKIFPLHGTRIRIADIPEFPECDIRAEAFNVGANASKIQGVYDEMFEHVAEIQARRDMSSQMKSASMLAEIMRARQDAELLKIPAICEMVDDYLENEHSVVLFCNFRETARLFCEALKTNCVVQGGQDADVREANIQRFQSDQSRIIVVNIQSGGAGLSLHDLNGKYPRSAIICPTYSAQDLKQATGRVWRAGAKTKALQVVFFAAGTIEEQICERVREKIQRIDALNDGDMTPPNLF